MAALSLRRTLVFVSLAVMLQPRRVYRAGVERLQPGAAQCGRGQQQSDGQEPGTAEEPDHHA